MTKTIQQVIEDLFVGKLIRFPGLSQQFQREQTHRILKVDISGTGDGMDGEAPPFSEVEVIFLTKTEGQGELASTVVCVDPTDKIEFIDETPIGLPLKARR
jgi:hypothetical protein